jgi:hypothetical protein
MQLSSAAQDFRNLANKLQQISEYDTHTDTQEPDHEITDSELSRLKIALRPLVSDSMQSRFTQVLNKMASDQPITFAESKLLTAAFISMADIIASDSTLISRLRKDISDYNDEAESSEEAPADEYSPELSPTDFEADSEEIEPETDLYQPK